MCKLDKLSNRQLEVLELLAQGLSNPDVAEQFGISVNTVKNHVASIFKLLEVKTRAEAICFFEEQGALGDKSTNTKINLLINYRNNHGDNFQRHVLTLKKYLSSWGVFDVDLSLDNQNSSSKHSYLIEASLFDDEGVLEHTWSIKRYESNKHYLNEVNYFELLNNKINEHSLIDIANQIYQALLVDIIGQPEIITRNNETTIKLISALHYFDQSDKSMLVTANQLCDEVIKAAPNNATAQGLKALILYRRMSLFQIEMDQDNFALLSAHALTAIKLSENNMWSQAAFAYHNLIHSKMNLAEKHFKRSLEINPCYYISAKMLAQVYCFNNKAEQGVELMEDTFRNYSNLSTISNFYTSLTILYYCAEQFEKAQDLAEKGLIYQDSNLPALLMALISLCEMKQEYKKVEKYKLAFANLQVEPKQLVSRLSLIRKMVPDRSYELFMASIKRAGFDFDKILSTH